MLDYAFMEKALPFLLKAIPVTLGLTFLVLVLSFLPALFLADRADTGERLGRETDHTLYFIHPGDTACAADPSAICTAS